MYTHICTYVGIISTCSRCPAGAWVGLSTVQLDSGHHRKNTRFGGRAESPDLELRRRRLLGSSGANLSEISSRRNTNHAENPRAKPGLLGIRREFRSMKDGVEVLVTDPERVRHRGRDRAKREVQFVRRFHLVLIIPNHILLSFLLNPAIDLRSFDVYIRFAFAPAPLGFLRVPPCSAVAFYNGQNSESSAGPWRS